MKKCLVILSALISLVAVVFCSGCNSPEKPMETQQISTEASTITPTLEPIVPTTAPTIEPTAEPITEPETENPAIPFFQGVWQGNDGNVTTIVINEDGTLFYREIYSAKIPTVEGVDGTWTAVDTKSIKMSIPGLGDGYELEGIVEGDGVVLKCTNGQPWSDETIRKATMTTEEIESLADSRIKELTLVDGIYYFEDINFRKKTGICRWLNGNSTIEFAFDDGTYLRISKTQIEATCELRLSDDAVVNPAGSLRVIPCNNLEIRTTKGGGPDAYKVDVSFADFASQHLGGFAATFIGWYFFVNDGRVTSLHYLK